jgi:hypothetical protein
MMIIEMRDYGFLTDDAANYDEYTQKYSGASFERSHFIAICGFFELYSFL